MRLALRIFTVLALGAIAAAAAVGVTLRQPTQYQSTSVLVVTSTGQRPPTEPAIRSLEALLVSPPVTTDIASRAQTDLSPAEVVDRMSVIRPPASAVLEVSVLDTDQDRSIALAREAGPALIARLDALPVGEEAGSNGFGVVTVNGEPTTEVVEPDRVRNGAIGLGIGLLLGIGLAASWRPRRNRAIRSETDASEAFGTPVYATLPLLGSGSRGRHELDVPAGLLPIGWPLAARRLVVLSSGERPSVRLIQLLAGAITRNGRNVLLIDAEPEERALTAAFGQMNRLGFFDCLAGRTDVASSTVGIKHEDLPREMSALVPPDGGRIALLPAGEVEVSPAAMAGDRIMYVLRQVPVNTTVVLHAPRVPGRFPANQFLEYADSVVVPVLAGRTKTEEAQSVSRLVGSISSAPVHVVLLTDRAGKRAVSSGADEDDETAEDAGPYAAAAPEEPASLASER